jgi:5-formyltetrahydrofolate cyclo-ligase
LNFCAGIESIENQKLKADWRKELKARFAGLEEKAKWTELLVEHLASFLHSRSGDWCIYQALDSEISLDSLLPKVPNVRWVYPKVMTLSDATRRLHFFEPRQGFEKAYAGILEPVLKDAREVSIKEIQGFLVPGLGFDPKGIRLGKGKGHYDRALQDFSGELVGVSFSSLIVIELPEDPWDIRMQWLATEQGLQKVKDA